MNCKLVPLNSRIDDCMREPDFGAASVFVTTNSVRSMINKSEYSDGKQNKRKMKLFTYLPKPTFRAEERGKTQRDGSRGSNLHDGCCVFPGSP